MANKKHTKDVTEEGFEAVEQALTKTEKVIEKHQKTILIAIAVVVVAVVSYFAFDKYYLQPLEEEAQVEIAAAQSYFAQDSLQLALNGDTQNLGFLAIIDDYGMTKTANLAHYYAGVCYLQLKDFDKAIDYLKGFSADDMIVSSMAIGAIGDAYMEKGETKKAISYYLDAANHKANELVSPMFLQKAAWAYESLQAYGKAKDMYTRILEEYADTNIGREAKKAIAYLNTK